MAVITESTFQFFGGAQKSLGADRRPANGPFRSGVSLHSHTMFSEESLDIVPRYTAKLPYVSRALRRQGARIQRQARSRVRFRQGVLDPSAFTPPGLPAGKKASSEAIWAAGSDFTHRSRRHPGGRPHAGSRPLHQNTAINRMDCPLRRHFLSPRFAQHTRRSVRRHSSRARAVHRRSGARKS